MKLYPVFPMVLSLFATSIPALAFGEVALTGRVSSPVTIYEVQSAQVVDSEINKTENQYGLMYSVRAVVKLKLNIEGNTCGVPLTQFGTSLERSAADYSNGILRQEFNLSIMGQSQPSGDPFKLGPWEACPQFAAPTDIALPIALSTFVIRGPQSKQELVDQVYVIKSEKVYGSPVIYKLKVSFDIDDPQFKLSWE